MEHEGWWSRNQDRGPEQEPQTRGTSEPWTLTGTLHCDSHTACHGAARAHSRGPTGSNLGFLPTSRALQGSRTLHPPWLPVYPKEPGDPLSTPTAIPALPSVPRSVTGRAVIPPGLTQLPGRWDVPKNKPKCTWNVPPAKHVAMTQT